MSSRDVGPPAAYHAAGSADPWRSRWGGGARVLDEERLEAANDVTDDEWVIRTRIVR